MKGTNPTCPGYCCAAFHFPRTITELRSLAKEKKIFDCEKIADMLVPLSPKQARERYESFSGKKAGNYFPWKQRGHHYTCRHWDEDTRLCKIYEDRPDMCRDYPYGQECHHGCGVKCGMPTKERQAIREERYANQWKAYDAPYPGKKRV